jgi:hypothetical protein
MSVERYKVLWIKYLPFRQGILTDEIDKIPYIFPC